jgi:hypothetical protein
LAPLSKVLSVNPAPLPNKAIFPPESKKKENDDDFDISLSSDDSDKRNPIAGGTKTVATPVLSKQLSPITSLNPASQVNSITPSGSVNPPSIPSLIPKPAVGKVSDLKKQPSIDSIDSWDEPVSKKDSFPLMDKAASTKSEQSSVKLPEVTSTPRPEYVSQSKISTQQLEKQFEQQEQEELDAFNRKLSALQQQKEAEYAQKLREVEMQFSTSLAKLEEESKRVIQEELHHLQALEIEINEHGPLIKFPPLPTIDVVSLRLAIEKYRIKFENSLITWWRKVNDEHENKLDRTKRKVEGENEKELEVFRETLIKEGEARFKLESEKMVHDQTCRLSDLREQHELEVKARKEELQSKLKSIELELERKIHEAEMKSRQMEIEMTSKFAEKQREWESRFAKFDSAHREHEFKMKEISQTSISSLAVKESSEERERRNTLDTREHELRSKERVILSKEKELIKLEVELKEREKTLDQRETRLLEQKESISKELEQKQFQLDQKEMELMAQKKSLARLQHSEPLKDVGNLELLTSEMEGLLRKNKEIQKPGKNQNAFCAEVESDISSIKVQGRASRTHKRYDYDDEVSDLMFSSDSE